MTILRIFLASMLVMFSYSVISPPDLSASDYELYVAQGIQKINQERYGEALKVLKKALAMSPDDPEAVYYSGIAHSRLGEYDTAENLFLRTIDIDSSAQNAYLELGRVYYSTGRCDKALTYLSKFISGTDNESAKQYAIKMKGSCQKEAKKEGKRFRLNVSVGAQYDSNVILEPSNPSANASMREKKDDGRGVALIFAKGTLFRSGPVKLKAKASIYQTVHGSLEEENLQDYKFNPFIEVDIMDPVTATAGYKLGYTLLGTEHYSLVHTFQGKVNVKEGRHFVTEGIYEYRDIKYWDDTLFPTNSLRSGHQNTIGLKQKLYIKKFCAGIYGYADFKRADMRYWSYDGYRAVAKTCYKIIPALKVKVSGEYSKKKYKDIFAGFTAKRSDDMQKYSVGFTYKISKVFSIIISDTYTINDSNLMDYDYERNVAGIFLKAGVL